MTSDYFIYSLNLCTMILGQHPVSPVRNEGVVATLDSMDAGKHKKYAYIKSRHAKTQQFLPKLDVGKVSKA